MAKQMFTMVKMEDFKKIVDGTIFSAEREKCIGEWIDGLPLFQKVIILTDVQTDGTPYEYEHGIEDIHQPIRVYSLTQDVTSPNMVSYGNDVDSRRRIRFDPTSIIVEIDDATIDPAVTLVVWYTRNI